MTQEKFKELVAKLRKTLEERKANTQKALYEMLDKKEENDNVDK